MTISTLSTICLFIMACWPPLDFAPPPLESMKIVLVHYDPGQGGINCDNDCGHLADMTVVTETIYNGKYGACIPAWRIGQKTGQWVMVHGYGHVQCHDRGGKIRPYYSIYHEQWVIPLDIVSHEPGEWNYQLFDWKLEGAMREENNQ